MLDDVEFLREKATEIIANSLSRDNLQLDDKVLTLVIDDREFVLSDNANTNNVSGEVDLGDGYTRERLPAGYESGGRAFKFNNAFSGDNDVEFLTEFGDL